MNEPAPGDQNLSARTAILVIAVFGLLFGYVGYLYLENPTQARSDVAAPTRSYTPEQGAAAQEVMNNARTLCGIREEPGHLVVECRWNIPTEQRLDFAVAIANADVVLRGGRARNIYYYLPGGGGTMFAQADPLNGVRLRQ